MKTARAARAATGKDVTADIMSAGENGSEAVELDMVETKEGGGKADLTCLFLSLRVLPRTIFRNRDWRESDP